MRTSVITGIFACAVVFFVTSGKTEAVSIDLTKINTPESALEQLLAASNKIEIIEEIAITIPEPLQIKHKVEKNETLTEIAKEFDTTWQRIFDKNTNIIMPDIINPGETLIIPAADEVLEPRELPVQESLKVQKKSAQTSSVNAVSLVGSSSGNGYIKGYCTWYVKNRRPDLPNNLGNAITWVSRAATQGLSTGSTPAVGAVGQSGNHVVYIESVNSDGSVTVSEMNFTGWNIYSTRTVSSGSFSYIY